MAAAQWRTGGAAATADVRKTFLLLREFFFFRWNFQMEQKTWLKCMIVTDNPELICFEYQI